MDFFRHQERARHNTTLLIILFALAVISFIIVANIVVMVCLGFPHINHGTGDPVHGLRVGGSGITFFASRFDWQLFFLVGGIVILLVALGSLYKYLTLKNGVSVAEAIDGQLIDRGTDDFQERVILNVVEEMAIASGMPIPPVYILPQERGINAFAAGFTTGDAVIGITKGAITTLNREELQGVIGHEFSHILNGDMRLNMRLISLLHGILFIGLIGRFLLYSARGSRSGRNASIPLMGLGLLVVGYIGTFFGGLIKAAVNRQREYLADASAVQFTRNDQGIAGALKKIGGYSAQSVLVHPEAHTLSHLFFCSGAKLFMQPLVPTHPPLAKRIRRIDPSWDGEFIRPVISTPQTTAQEKEEQQKREKLAKTAAVLGAAAALRTAAPARTTTLPETDETPPKPPAGVTAQQNFDEQIAYATELLKTIPEELRRITESTYGARTIIYALVINKDEEVYRRQLQQLKEHADTGIYEMTFRILPQIKALDIRSRLPLIELSLTTLRQLSRPQYRAFKENLNYLIQADHRIEQFEWALQKILFSRLDRHFFQPTVGRNRQRVPISLKDDINILFSSLLYSCIKDPDQREKALAEAERELYPGITLLPVKELSLRKLDKAIQRLTPVKDAYKKRILATALSLVTTKKNYAAKEVELVRAFASILDCPMPPLPE